MIVNVVSSESYFNSEIKLTDEALERLSKSLVGKEMAGGVVSSAWVEDGILRAKWIPSHYRACR